MKMKKKDSSASLPTLRRLPRYIHVLKRLKLKNIEYVSATTIAGELEIESIQVRKDLSVTGIVGKPKIGFELDELIISIQEFLNWNKQEDAYLIGAGGLGKAIVSYENFKNYGLNIVAIFDNNKKKIGKKINGLEVLPLDKLYDLGESKNVKIGVITTPASAAQEVCDKLIINGVKAIWNFSPVSLKAPKDIIIESVHLSQSLAVLTHKLSMKVIEK